MIIDAHVHMGQFYHHYFTPERISSLMQRCGVSFYLISSTTTCEENYDKVMFEFRRLIDLDKNKVLPCLWLTESILSNENNLSTILSMYNWKCLKIHPALRCEEWRAGSTSINTVFEVASKNKLPLLIHTGEDENCCSKKYEEQIKHNQDVKVVLAHGRPLEQAIYMCQKYPNVYVDTAFMPITDISAFIEAGYSNRILWGSDAPINEHFYPDINTADYLTNRLDEFKQSVSPLIFQQITELNFHNIFNIQISYHKE